MAVTLEYWTAVYAVGLDGLSDNDHLELNEYAADGWEPVLMTAVHGGFGTLVLFRRETEVARPEVPRKAASVNKALTKASPAKKAKAVKKGSSTKRQ